ncbi:MAG TPA: efflux RND transporter periplasmic adaptor subunit [Polyangiaceae bacterium]|nr:efflux RND transporter periplasmic adaptor subunit [Polyangiaceae bacterium]
MDHTAREPGPQNVGVQPALTRGEPQKPRRIVLYFALGIALLLGAVFMFSRKRAANAGAAAAASGSAAAAARPTPVVVAEVQLKDVPIYLEGIGNATPLSTVTVKTQVDGRLDKIFFTEGQSVKRGELLAQIDPRPFQIALQQAQAAIAKDSASSNNALLNQKRYQSLVEQKLISQQQADDQKALAQSAMAAVDSDRAQAASARLQLDYAQIKSPIDGVTGVRLVDQGNIVHAADQSGIVIVTQLDPMAVVFTLPEDDFPRVSQALAQGQLSVEAYSRDAVSLLAKGQLLLIDNQVNQQTATIKLKASFPNAQRTLWPNAFVKTRLLLTTRKGALVVPATAIQRGPQGTFVYLVDAANKASVRPVVLETTQDELVILKSGLVAGDKVVVEGQNALRAGASVAPRPPATSSGAGANGPGAKP